MFKRNDLYFRIFLQGIQCRGNFLSVEAVESYTLGSSEKQIVSEDKELFNLESRVEIEKSIKQMEEVLTALQKKLREVESKLSLASRGS